MLPTSDEAINTRVEHERSPVLNGPDFACDALPTAVTTWLE